MSLEAHLDDYSAGLVQSASAVGTADQSKPNFFIVGFPKCGTTTLYENLRLHPEVYMPYDWDNFWIYKEPNYFDTDIDINPGFSIKTEHAYLQLFDQATTQKRIGESSTFYAYSKNAPIKIHAMDSSAKFIFMLRNPAEMIYSWHYDCLRYGHEDILDFEAALAAEADRKAGKRIPKRCYYPQLLAYREMGKYSSHIQRYIDQFGRDQVLVILLDELKTDAEAVYKKVFDFLEISHDHKIVDEVFNPRIPLPRLHHLSFPLWDSLNWLEARFKWVPKSVWNVASKVIHRSLFIRGTIKRTPLTQATRKEINQSLKEDMHKVEAITGKDLSAWYSAN